MKMEVQLAGLLAILAITRNKSVCYSAYPTTLPSLYPFTLAVAPISGTLWPDVYVGNNQAYGVQQVFDGDTWGTFAHTSPAVDPYIQLDYGP